jgi:hypothetical protein
VNPLALSKGTHLPLEAIKLLGRKIVRPQAEVYTQLGVFATQVYKIDNFIDVTKKEKNRINILIQKILKETSDG